MIKFITLLTLFVTSVTFGADVKISSLPLGSGSTTGINDSFPYVDSATMVTKRLTLYDLVNVPLFVATYAPINNPTFTGTLTAPTILSTKNTSDPLSSVYGHSISLYPSYTANNTDTAYGVTVIDQPDVSSTKTLSNAAGLASDTSLAAGAGTVTNLSGLKSTFGIKTGSTGDVTNAYGLNVIPYHQAGTITNSYGLYLTSPVTGGTVTNEWGVYGASTTAKNYLGGSLWLGLSSSTNKLHQDAGTATANYHQFTANATTGQSSSDGLLVGIDATGNAILNQQEALPMNFYTAGALKATLLSDGKLGLGVTTPVQKYQQDAGTATANYHQFTANATTGQTATDGMLVGIDSSANGIINQQETLPIKVSTAGAQRLLVSAAGSVVVGNSASALATSATDGFLYISTSAGAPVGTPSTQTGSAPIHIDTTNNAFYYYSGATWRSVGSSSVQGTRQTGTSMSVGTAITPVAGSNTVAFVVGNGGPITITASPPVVVSGMGAGQELKICGTSNTNTVTYTNGVNLVLNGSATLGKDQCLNLLYAGSDGTNSSWIETSRSF